MGQAVPPPGWQPSREEEEALAYLAPYRPPDYMRWHLRRITSCIEHLRSKIALSNLKTLDLGHDPHVGLLLNRTGLVMTGNLAPGSDAPREFVSPTGERIRWSLDEFDLERGLPYADGSFDLVTAFEVVEHISTSPRSVIQEIRRVLRSGGYFYAGTPNVNAWAKLMRQFRGGQLYDSLPYSSSYGPRHFMSHVYEYSVWELRELLKSEGFEVVALKTWDPYPDDPTGVRRHVLQALLGLSLAVTGHFREAAQLFRHRGHQIGLLVRAPLRQGV